MSSQLAEDLKDQGIECIEKVPQIAEVREAQSLFDNVTPILQANHLESNIAFVLNNNAAAAGAGSSSSPFQNQDSATR